MLASLTASQAHDFKSLRTANRGKPAFPSFPQLKSLRKLKSPFQSSILTASIPLVSRSPDERACLGEFRDDGGDVVGNAEFSHIMPGPTTMLSSSTAVRTPRLGAILRPIHLTSKYAALRPFRKLFFGHLKQDCSSLRLRVAPAVILLTRTDEEEESVGESSLEALVDAGRATEETGVTKNKKKRKRSKGKHKKKQLRPHPRFPPRPMRLTKKSRNRKKSKAARKKEVNLEIPASFLEERRRLSAQRTRNEFHVKRIECCSGVTSLTFSLPPSFADSLTAEKSVRLELELRIIETNVPKQPPKRHRWRFCARTFEAVSFDVIFEGGEEVRVTKADGQAVVSVSAQCLSTEDCCLLVTHFRVRAYEVELLSSYSGLSEKEILGWETEIRAKLFGGLLSDSCRAIFHTKRSTAARPAVLSRLESIALEEDEVAIPEHAFGEAFRLFDFLSLRERFQTEVAAPRRDEYGSTAILGKFDRHLGVGPQQLESVKKFHSLMLLLRANVKDSSAIGGYISRLYSLVKSNLDIGVHFIYVLKGFDLGWLMFDVLHSGVKNWRILELFTWIVHQLVISSIATESYFGVKPSFLRGLGASLVAVVELLCAQPTSAGQWQWRLPFSVCQRLLDTWNFVLGGNTTSTNADEQLLSILTKIVSSYVPDDTSECLQKSLLQLPKWLLEVRLRGFPKFVVRPASFSSKKTDLDLLESCFLSLLDFTSNYAESGACLSDSWVGKMFKSLFLPCLELKNSSVVARALSVLGKGALPFLPLDLDGYLDVLDVLNPSLTSLLRLSEHPRILRHAASLARYVLTVGYSDVKDRTVISEDEYVALLETALSAIPRCVKLLRKRKERHVPYSCLLVCVGVGIEVSIDVFLKERSNITKMMKEVYASNYALTDILWFLRVVVLKSRNLKEFFSASNRELLFPPVTKKNAAFRLINDVSSQVLSNVTAVSELYWGSEALEKPAEEVTFDDTLAALEVGLRYCEWCVRWNDLARSVKGVDKKVVVKWKVFLESVNRRVDRFGLKAKTGAEALALGPFFAQMDGYS